MSQQDQWNYYLNSIYEWVQEKYKMYIEGKISEQEYYQALEFYEEETQIVDFIRKEDFSFLEPEEIQRILRSFEKITEVSSVREFIEQKYQEQKQETENVIEAKSIVMGEEPSVENIPQPPTLEELGITITNQAQTQGRRNITTQHITTENGTQKPQQKHDNTRRIEIVGSRAVGKTQLKQELEEKPRFKIKITTKEGDYYPKREELLETNIIIAVYDITRPDTIFHLEKWLKSTYKTTNFSIPLIIFGNKKDLQRLRIVPETAGKEILEKLKVWSNISGFALEGSCIQEKEKTKNMLWKALENLKENT